MAFEEQQPFDPASFEHIPVLLNECLTGLAIDPAGTYLDGTAGGAGHSRQIAMRGRRWSSWALKRSTVHCWILAFPATSWMMPPGAFPTGQTHRWICA